MFCNFCKSMASCVMAFILLTGCAERGRIIETTACTDSLSESVLWSDLRQEDVSTDQDSRDLENEADESAAKQEGKAGKIGGETGDEETYADRDVESEASGLYVDVCGAVNRPGVVKVPEGARVFEAIEKAGGLSADADGRYVNKARKLTDGEQIYVPAKDETDGQTWQFRSEDSGDGNSVSAGTGTGNSGGTGAGTAAGAAAAGKVNINTADSATLQTLTGIGESRAEAIILYRETNGAFETIEDIMKVTGIKNALFNNIKNDITV